MQQLEMLRQMDLFRKAGELPGIGQELSKVTEQLVFALAVAGLVLALLQCFCGYRMVRFWMTLIGFAAGFALGAGLVRMSGDSRPVLLFVLGGITGGALLAILSFKLYLLGVFLYCGLLAAGLVTMSGLPKAEGWKMAGLVLMLIAFVAAGVLAVKFQRHFVIAVTAVTGGFAAAKFLPPLIPEMQADPKMAASAGIVLAILGAAVQLLTTRSGKKTKKR